MLGHRVLLYRLKHHFNKAIQYSWGAIFSSDLDLKLIPLIRCEPDVEYLEFNQVVTISTATPN
jgi:hypothetical protein